MGRTETEPAADAPFEVWTAYDDELLGATVGESTVNALKRVVWQPLRYQPPMPNAYYKERPEPPFVPTADSFAD